MLGGYFSQFQSQYGPAIGTHQDSIVIYIDSHRLTLAAGNGGIGCIDGLLRRRDLPFAAARVRHRLKRCPALPADVIEAALRLTAIKNIGASADRACQL